MTSKYFAVSALCALLFAGPAASQAAIFTHSSGNLAASAEFTNPQAGVLQLTLTNTSTADVLVPTDVLTAVFFDIPGDPELTPLSAVLGTGSVVWFDDQPAGGVVGGEWAYLNALSDAPNGATQGISSTGADDMFGPHDLFPGDDLEPPLSPNGLSYGITSAGDNPHTGNLPVTGRDALIFNSVVFQLEGLPADFSLDQIDNVYFLYGTSLPGPDPQPPVPEPASLAIWTLIGMAAGLWGYRRHRKAVA